MITTSMMTFVSLVSSTAIIIVIRLSPKVLSLKNSGLVLVAVVNMLVEVLNSQLLVTLVYSVVPMHLVDLKWKKLLISINLI